MIILIVFCFREDLAQLALFNKTIDNNTKYYDFYDEIMPWINDNWENIAPGKVGCGINLFSCGPTCTP